MADLHSAIARSRKAAQVALSRGRRVTGQQMDEDLMIYERLKPQDFGALAERYGQENVVKYIKTMTARKVTQNG